MRLLSTLAAAAVLLCAAPAFAQVSVSQDAAVATPAMAAAQADLEAAGLAIQPVFEAMDAQAAAIRADASLSAADKATRVQALIAANQPAVDRFAAALSAYVIASAEAEGASPEEAASASAMIQSMLTTQLAHSLLTGESAE